MKSALTHTTALTPPVNSRREVPSRRAVLAWLAGATGVGVIIPARPLAHAAPLLQSAPSQQAPSTDGGQQTATGTLFDGASLGAWQSVNFGGEGEVRVEDGAIVLERGNDLTGIVWTGPPLPSRYVIEVEAKRVDGTDFFCALTFPVADTHCTFVVGGWGGSLIGFSSIDGYDASENETAQVRQLVDDRWYRIGVEVTPERMRGRLDDEWLAEVETEGRQIDVRIEMLACRPLGLASYRTISAIRTIEVTPLEG